MLQKHEYICGNVQKSQVQSSILVSVQNIMTNLKFIIVSSIFVHVAIDIMFK